MNNYQPPYHLTERILELATEISQLIVQVNYQEKRRTPKLRRSSRIRTIHSSLAIEQNSMSLDKVEAIMDGKHVVGPKREVLELQNAIKAYDEIEPIFPETPNSPKQKYRLSRRETDQVTD